MLAQQEYGNEMGPDYGDEMMNDQAQQQYLQQQ
jgi:hypothetical protein